MGSRGSSGGGHAAMPKRSTSRAEISAPKNIASAPMKNRTARRRLSSPRRGPRSRSSSPSPPKSGGAGGIRPLVRRSDGGRGGACTTGVMPSPPDPGQQRREGERRQDAEQDAERQPVARLQLAAGARPTEGRAHALSSASSASSAGR